ncbi:MAG: hypothetical protein U1E49_20340 [Hyphomicrobiaceae bacterium]
MSEESNGTARRKPVNPYLVLAAAIVLPASGHIWLGLTQRAMTFLFFMIILGWLTSKAAPPDASFIGRHAGGVLVYAVSLLDAYRIARLRYAVWRQAAG